jgi:hypothetical protein
LICLVQPGNDLKNQGLQLFFKSNVCRGWNLPGGGFFWRAM